MIQGLGFGSPEWFGVAIGLFVVTSCLLLWNLLRSPVKGWSVWLSGLLKLLAIASTACYLVEPLVRSERPQPGANLLAIAVDNSRSMEIRAPGETASMLDKLKPLLKSDSAWQTRAAQDFALRRYAFDTRPRAVDSFDELNFGGQASAVGATIETVRSRFASRPTVGMLLFSDGMSTDSLPSLSDGNAEQEAMPIYVIVDLGRTDIRDISVIDPTVTQSAFEIAPVRVEATIAVEGLDGRDVTARLTDEKGETLDVQQVKVDSPSFRKRLRFQYKPKELGIQFVRVREMLTSEDDEQDTELVSRSEMTTANNSRLLSVDRGGGPYRILYVAGRPNWEFKFLKRALDEDDELDCVGLIRIAKKEAKFAFRDRAVDSTNPLFAGFDNTAEDATEQYDETIMLPIGVGDKDELKGGFPKTEEELFAYDAILLDDIEAKFFNQAQMLLLRQFVAERGGGLMMLGGQESFDKGGYRDTALGDLLPVYMRGGPYGNQDKSEKSVAFRLTREGGLEPWMRLRGSEADEAKRLAEMPTFLTWNAVSDAKPGASILATLGGEGEQPVPGLVTQSFGSGRTAALMVGDMWRWGMRRVEDKNDDLAQSWRQLARWLTADVPRRVSAEVVPPQRSTDPVDIAITVRDEKFQVVDNAVIRVEVLQPDGKLVSASVTPDRKRPGVYHASFWSNTDGPYVASISASGPDGVVIGEREVGWTAEPSAAEFNNLAADLTPLRELAERSGGEVIDIDDLDRFVASLPTRKVPITQERVDPLWHRTSWLLLTIVCLCAEWGLRRWRGLP